MHVGPRVRACVWVRARQRVILGAGAGMSLQNKVEAAE